MAQYTVPAIRPGILHIDHRHHIQGEYTGIYWPVYSSPTRGSIAGYTGYTGHTSLALSMRYKVHVTPYTPLHTVSPLSESLLVPSLA